MKKIMLSFFALAIAVSFSSSAFAKSGLSVSLGVGLKGDLNGLGGTITDDGLDGGEEQALWGKAVIDEKTLLFLEDATVVGGNTFPGALVEDVEANGAMSGLDFALGVRYDFLDKFFAKVGFNYTMKIMGGETSWKYTSVAAAAVADGVATAGSAGNAAIYNAIFADVNAAIDGYEGKQTWASSAWGVPVLFGINVPALDGKVNFYIGLGVCVSSATWSLELETLDVLYGIYAAPGDAVNTSTEKVEFSYTGIAPMYTIGADAEVGMGVSVFIEWEVVLGIGYSDVKSIKTDVGVAALGTNKLAYPTVTGGSIIRVGASYKLPIL